MLYEGRRLTATEAKATGLVDDTLWPATFREDLMSRVQSFAAHSSEVTLDFPPLSFCSFIFLQKAPLRLTAYSNRNEPVRNSRAHQ